MTVKKKKKVDENQRDRGRPPVDKKEPPERYSLDVNYDLDNDLDDDLLMDGDEDLRAAGGGDGLDDALDDAIDVGGGMSEEGPESEGHQIQIWKSTKYTAHVRKGFIGDSGVEVLIWDKVRDCRADDCPIFQSCPYMATAFKRKKAAELRAAGKRIGNCGVEMKYIYHIEQPFLAMMQKSPEPFIMQTIGMHLIPLYHDLIQLKIEKAGLKEITYRDSKGTLRIHPVFDQLDKVHKMILTAWRSSRLMQFAIDAGFFKAGGSMLPKDDLDEYGAMAYGMRDGGAGSGVTEAAAKAVKAKVVKAKVVRKPKVVEPEPEPVELVMDEVDEFDGI